MSKTIFPPCTQTLTCFGNLVLTRLNVRSNCSPEVSSSFCEQLCEAEVAVLCNEAAGTGKTPLGGEWEGQHRLCRLPLTASVNMGGAGIERESREKRPEAAALIVTELLGRLCVLSAAAQTNPKWGLWSYPVCKGPQYLKA